MADERGPASPAPKDATYHGVVRHRLPCDRAPEEPPVVPLATFRGGDGP
ncbi:hypothetical protein [Streptomyces hydrogenans]